MHSFPETVRCQQGSGSLPGCKNTNEKERRKMMSRTVPSVLETPMSGKVQRSPEIKWIAWEKGANPEIDQRSTKVDEVRRNPAKYDENHAMSHEVPWKPGKVQESPEITRTAEEREAKPKIAQFPTNPHKTQRWPGEKA